MFFSIRLATLCRFFFSGNDIIAAGKYLDKITYLMIIIVPKVDLSTGSGFLRWIDE